MPHSSSSFIRAEVRFSLPRPWRRIHPELRFTGYSFFNILISKNIRPLTLSVFSLLVDIFVCRSEFWLVIREVLNRLVQRLWLLMLKGIDSTQFSRTPILTLRPLQRHSLQVLRYWQWQQLIEIQRLVPKNYFMFKFYCVIYHPNCHLEFLINAMFTFFRVQIVKYLIPSWETKRLLNTSLLIHPLES